MMQDKFAESANIANEPSHADGGVGLQVRSQAPGQASAKNTAQRCNCSSNTTQLPLAWRPPMGWNSWDSYGTTVSEEEVLANARFMAQYLLPYGWDTIVIDIDWYDPTARDHGYNENAPLILDEYGRQMPDPVRFPSAADGTGFTHLAEQLHKLGLKLGLHMMRGIPRLAVERNVPVKGTSYTAQDIADVQHVCKWNPDNYGLNHNHPAAQSWYDAQVELFASWKVDFLKVDDMQTPFYTKEIHAYHSAIERAKAVTGQDITLSLSPGGWMSTNYVDFLRANTQMWRISDDLWDRWEDIFQQFARLARWAPYQQEGHWADADMLPLGHIGLRAERGDDRDSKLTVDERRTLLALWCMGRSPLMVGGDLPTSTQETIALLQNPYLQEVTAGSVNPKETLRERIFTDWSDPDSFAGELIIWQSQAHSWVDGTPSKHPDGVYAALFWTGNEPYELSSNIELQSLVGIERAEQPFQLHDCFANVSDNATPAKVWIEGEGRDRRIRGTIPAHGVLWVVLD